MPRTEPQPLHVDLRGQRVPVLLERGRGRGVRLGVTPEGLVVRTPTGKLNEALPFIQEKEGWIVKHYANLSRSLRQVEQFRRTMFQQGLLFGRPVQFSYHAAPARKLVMRGDDVQLHCPEAQLRADPHAMLRRALVSLSKHYLAHRTEHWRQVCGLEFNALRIKDVRSRWGSCSSERNINLNWHLVLVDKALSDYVIVHELMHLHEMNHSDRFWAWVGQYLPDHAQRRAQLRTYQWLIGIYTPPNTPPPTD